MNERFAEGRESLAGSAGERIGAVDDLNQSARPADDWLPDSRPQFSVAWRSGERPRLGDYIAGTSKQRREQLLQQLLCVELELRRQDGEQPTPDEYERQFPDQVSLVRRVFRESEARKVMPHTPHVSSVLHPLGLLN